MYKITIPITAGSHGAERDKIAAELLRAKADRVLLCSVRSIEPSEVKRAALNDLPQEIEYFRSLGLEVGVWISTLGHGCDARVNRPYQRIVGDDGSTQNDSFCPLDENFAQELCDYIADLGRTNPDLILLDDDYRLGARSGAVGCFCPLHLQAVSDIVGYAVTCEDVVKSLGGKPNSLRSAWMQANGNSLLTLAKKMRAALDEVAPHVRLGHCAVMDTWDIDGIDSVTLSKAFAGKTKPILRLIGAPYWSFPSCDTKLADVIELERMQAVWCDGADIEVLSEGDVFPRPRHNVPAAVLEDFDTALRADGRTDGILKYMIDYACPADYETGYIDRHVRHMPIYEKIDEIFGGLRPAGVRVYDCMRRLRDAEIPTEIDGNYILDDFNNAASRFLCDLSVPMQYTEPDVTVIFGENARHVPSELLQNGAVLDGIAAKILTERGFDVGVEEIDSAFAAKSEYYPDEDTTITFRSGMYGADGATCFQIVPKESALRITEFFGEHSAWSYQYENKDGQRFLVYPFDAQRVRKVSMLFRCYYKQHQFNKSLAWLRRRPADVYIPDHPDLYVQTKRNNNTLAVGLWNFFPDEIFEPQIQLGETWKSAEYLNCSGELDGNTLTLSDIPPYGFAAVRLKK